jgi:hypothetical protein
LPRITYINRTKQNSKIIEPKDFAPKGKYENYKPHPFVPLPDKILDEFKKLGGKHMAFCDEFALHTNFLKTHKQYVTNKFPEAEKPKIQKQISTIKPPPIVDSTPLRINKEVENISDDPKATQSWNQMIEECRKDDHKALHAQQVERPASAQNIVPPPAQPIPLPQPNQPIPVVQPQPQPSTSSSIFYPYGFANVPTTPIPDHYIIQLSMAQLQNMLDKHAQSQAQSPRQSQQQQPQSTVQPQVVNPEQTVMSTQDWEFSQSQPPQGHSMFPATQESQRQPAEKAKSASLTNLQIPKPVYHPSISPQPKPPQETGASRYPQPVYHPTIKRPYEPSTVEVEQERILPGSLIWSSTGHYHPPQWTKVAHSACSLYDLVDHSTITDQEKARHLEMPHFRQFAVDGVNLNTTMTVYLSKVEKREVVVLKTTAVKYFKLATRPQNYYKPFEHQITIPTHAFARFILMFYEIAKTALPPAMMDVRESQYELLYKQTYISNDYVNIRIYTQEGMNGIERMVSVAMDDERKERTGKPIVFPWIRMANVLIAMRRVHEDMKQTGYI